MADSRVLIIDEDEQRQSRLAAVLEFVECRPEPAPALAELAGDKTDRRQWMAIVVGQVARREDLEAFLAWLREDPLHPPLLMLPEHHGRAARERLGLDADSCWDIEYPARYVQISDLLSRASGQQIEDTFNRRHKPVGGPTGQSEAIKRVRHLIRQVAEFDTTVLILGESGTGKEVAARAIHDHSERAAKPFVAINCGAIPADLLESELFGHEKGSFTGAVSARQGRFEMAEGGTLFLDEIGDISLPMQVKLLRILQEKCYERVGSNESRSTDVRIIAATHRDLEKRIADGAFREDLFYRLNVFPVEMPPLRERLADLPALIEAITGTLDVAGGRPIRFDEAALKVLSAYPWPGNVRELANLVERMAVLHAGQTITPAELPERYQPALPAATEEAAETVPERADPEPVLGEPIDLREYLAGVEQRLIRRALGQANGVVAHAAQLLGLRRTTLVEKIRKFGIEVD